eukprot:GHVR01150504.1.p1 GENE.GHVR01150504.1~~GHVR01150504.1.p1  ORF type:complete len:384 (-),score=102.05 GHVR01150504.1:303-1454(-)
MVHDTMIRKGLVQQAINNKGKNRYSNIYPYDRCLVKLKASDGYDNRYINATWIHLPIGFNDIKTTQTPTLTPATATATTTTTTTPPSTMNYIITSGPMHPEYYGADTCVDFWRMVWQERVPVVVMLANVTPGVQGCAAYFPCLNHPYINHVNDIYFNNNNDNNIKNISNDINILGSCIHGNIRIDLLDEKRCCDSGIERTFRLTCQGDNTSELRLSHFQFTTWPNYGLPEQPQSFASFVQAVEAGRRRAARVREGRTKDAPKKTGGVVEEPIVVHCSGGVGRSGTFVGVMGCVRRVWSLVSQTHTENDDILLDQFYKCISVKADVLCMRKDRHPAMIEGFGHYQFAYIAIGACMVLGVPAWVWPGLHSCLDLPVLLYIPVNDV